MAPGKVALFSTIVIFAVLCFSTAVSGTTYLVRPDGSGDFITIQAAIDAAQDSDVIELSDGTFTGTGNRDIDFKGKAITVRSQSKKPEVCIIDCQAGDSDKHRGFIFHSDEGADAVLEYVTIRNGNKNWPGAFVYPDTCAGGAILVRGASPTIRHTIIENNFANDSGGIDCREGSNARILHNRILNNTAQDDFGGIGLVNPGNVEVIGNVIFENHSTSTAGGMGVHAGDEVIIQDNLFIDNDCMRTDGMQSWGAGLTAGFNSNLDIVNNTFAYNGGDDGTTRYGGGIYAFSGSNAWISNSIFYRNGA